MRAMMALRADRKKRSVTLNIRTEGGRAILRKLVTVSDVVVENFKRGDWDKMRAGYDALRQINPPGYPEAHVKQPCDQGVI
jgi:crotonobetainyl-CoA:carnitine CoA-transferase CaiB-like acyl-CoA transferase